jgi:hypothetical protein
MWVEALEEIQDRVVEEMQKFHFAHVLDSQQYELWAHKDGAGNITFHSKKASDSNRRFDEHECLIFSCGGDNTTVWDVLPPVESFLDEEEINELIDDSNDSSLENIIPQAQKYVEEYKPDLIGEQLEVYRADENGYIYDRLVTLYEQLISDLDGQ